MQTRRTLTSNTKNTHIQMTKVPTKWTKTQQLKIENWYKLLTSYEKLFYFAGCQPKSHCSMKSLEINNHKGKTKLKAYLSSISDQIKTISILHSYF